MQSIPQWSSDPVVARRQLKQVVDHLYLLTDSMGDLVCAAQEFDIGDIEKDADSAWCALGIAYADLSKALAKTTLMAQVHKQPKKSRSKLRIAS